MALKNFTDLAGKAENSGVPRMKFKDGKNVFRIVSPVVPMYKYWLKDADGASIPMECLAFDREKEKFTRVETDHVQKHFPDVKASWAYCSFVIDRTDGRLKILDHKKKLFEQIIRTAKKLGKDPTSWEEGWDIPVEREKTGPQAFNVEYHLEVLDIEPKPLSDADREVLKDMPDIEEYLSRQTPEEQLQIINERILNKGQDEETTEEDAPEDFADSEESEDKPF